jgi:hypothetical protein
VFPTNSATMSFDMPFSSASVMYPCHTAYSVNGGMPAVRSNRRPRWTVFGAANGNPLRVWNTTSPAAELDARYMAVSVVRQAARPASPDGGVEVLTSRAQVLCTVVQGVAERLYTLTGGPYQSYQGRKRLCHLVRCLFDNPFRPVVFDAKWRTETAVALATGIYEERAFDRLPILADALEEAGCDHADVLSHCRGPPYCSSARTCMSCNPRRFLPLPSPPSPQ